MFLIDNFLKDSTVQTLKELVDFEIETALCLSAPRYQSYNYMHLKHKDNECLKELLTKTKDEAKKFLGKEISVRECWFNICRKDSAFNYHTHSSRLTAVFFLKGCNGNGTLFKINNATLQLKTDDNSLLLFNPSLMHTIPNWENEDRYSIAIDFEV